MSKLLLKNIYKVYEGGVRAVNDFNLEINDKEFVVFVGPSGCGKSTTLRMIAGLEEITSGELYIDDVLENDIEPKDRNIAMVFQNYALYPHMTVFQNMAFGLKLRKEDSEEIKHRVEEAAKILNITDLLDRKPKALSGGQRQRVALGRAIVRDPSVFLLDEPLSNLDAKLRVQMRTEITKLHEKLETTFIYVTHDQTEAMTMGDKIVVMKDGYIQQVDSPATLYEEPANVFVATFLGSPQMNIFPVTLEKEKSLSIKFGENKVNFSELRSKQLINKEKIGNVVLFGIRPENINLGDKIGIKATIDQLEHLGSQTIIYAHVDGVDNKVIATIPTNHDLKSKDEIYLNFDMEKAHLFDKETNLSILGVPNYNSFDIKLNKDSIKLGEKEYPLNEILKKHLFDFTFEEATKMLIETKKVSLFDVPESIHLSMKIDFIVHGAEYDALYGLVEGKKEHFVIRDKMNIHQVNEVIDLYLPLKDIFFVDKDNNRVSSKEIVSDDVAEVTVSTKNNITSIKLGKTILKYPNLNVEDGNYLFKLKSNKLGFIYDRQFIKKNKLKVENITNNNTLRVSSYDEDNLGKKNAVFVKIDGFNNYVTLVLDNLFSVYQMPKFKVIVNEDSFELIKK